VSEGGSRRALIVAVADYSEPKLARLRAPATDAERLAAVLRDPEIGAFEVDLSLDEDEPRLSRRIARFFSGRHPDDLLFLHFSCHGVKDDAGELHLATTDTEMGDLLGVTSISSSWLSRQIDRSRSKRIVVLLDCCFSGSFPFGMRARAGADVDVRGALEGRGRAVITASSSMEYAYEGDELSGSGTPSIFTSAVVEGLASGKADRDQDRRISIDELYDYVFDQVRERTPSQSPQMMSSLEGPLYIARSSFVAPVEAATLDEQLVALAESPLAGARLGAVAELGRLLASSDPAAALAARERLTVLTRDDSQRVSSAARGALDGVAETRTEQEQSSAVPSPSPPPEPERPARWSRRSAATAIDSVIVWLVGILPAMGAWASQLGQEPLPGGVTYGVGATMLVLGGVLYTLLFRSARRGQTAGKRAYALAVRSHDGSSLGTRQMLVRETVKWLLLGPSWGFAAVLLIPLASVRTDGRALHDLVAGTTVVQRPVGSS
jgi:uncharacterized RDD family membrane protein YckC/uncharacterized caspase-like protein